LDKTLREQPASNFQGVDKNALRAVKIRSIQRVNDLQLLGMLFPCIEYLDLEETDATSGIWDDDTGSTRVLLTVKDFFPRHTSVTQFSTQVEWAQKLRSFRNLRALYGIPFLSSMEQEEENQARIALLADLFPRIVFLDDPPWRPFHAIEIIRGAYGLTWRTTTKYLEAFDNTDPE
jgi:hypothetical protein